MKIAFFVVGVLVLGIALGYYFGYDIGWERAIGTDTPASSQEAGMANPASTHCVELGGELEIVDGVEGQYGLCHLPDGRVCEEWALFRDGSCTVPQ